LKINQAKIYNKSIPELKDDVSRHHGHFFEIVLASTGEILRIEDSRNLYLLRHYLTFIVFWISVIFLYLTILHVFKNKWLGLLGCAFLILSPRIFAHSFYNSKDIAFMSFCIFGIYTQTRFLNKKNYINAVLHALCCGLLIDIRIVGIYIPCLTLFSYYADAIITKEINLNKLICIPATYIFLLFLFIYVFWPYLWEDPINNFVSAFKTMKQYPSWDNEILYFGNIIKFNELPWHYIPSWILITTPILYSILFFVGLITSTLIILLNPRILTKNNKEKYILIFILLFFSPLIAVIIFNSVLYSGWRHLYFIYPPFILIASAGFYYLINSKFISSSKYKSIPKFIIILLTTLSIMNTTWQMISYHPHQYVYFNFLAGKKVLGKFDMDYWGLSYKQLYEYILSNSNKTRIYVINTNKKPGRLNRMILDKESRKRIIIVKDVKIADYVLTAYRRKKYVRRSELNKKPYINEIYSISLDNKKIASVFEPKSRKQ